MQVLNGISDMTYRIAALKGDSIDKPLKGEHIFIPNPNQI